MTTPAEHDQSDESAQICPYWHQMGADFASMYPSGGYCVAGCHQKVKVMAGKTVEEVCLLRYGDCEGYQRVLAEQAAKERRTPDNTSR